MSEKITYFQELIDSKRWRELRSELLETDDLELVDVIEDLPEKDDVILFRLLNREKAKNCFSELTHDKKEKIVAGLIQNVDKVAGLLNDLDPDDRTAFFEELPGQISQRLIQLLSSEERKIAIQLLGYPEDSIGRLMTPDFVAVKPHFTVEETLAHIRKYGHDSETLNVVYVVDKNWRLIGDIRIREIILSDPGKKIEELLDPNRFVALNATDDQEVAIPVFQDHDRVALPVVDSEGLLLGIITFDDMMDVVEEETTEDFHKFGSFSEAIINPLKARIFYLYKQRILWLTILVFMNIFSGAAIASFEGVIQSVVSLLFFLPLLIGSAGNAGAQSATLMIRSLAVGDVELKDWVKLLLKEVVVSLLLGITMAAAVAILASFRAPEVIVVVFLTMVITVMIGSMIGLTLPFVLAKFKKDPATASAPLITSIADILGIVIYFTIATLYFNV